MVTQYACHTTVGCAVAPNSVVAAVSTTGPAAAAGAGAGAGTGAGAGAKTRFN